MDKGYGKGKGNYKADLCVRYDFHCLFGGSGDLFCFYFLYLGHYSLLTNTGVAF